tara:strand:+ start:128 stop:421 length:294 start_codon:yes stop_codon:yes gene_type:complete
MFSGCIKRLRIIGLIEGISYLILLLVAMPLKYLADSPQMVTWTGSIHGALFVIYALALLQVTIVKSWSIWTASIPFIAAMVPFGPFIIDGWIRKKDL